MRSPLPHDMDVIWFDETRAYPDVDASIEATLQARDGTLIWSVKNQARMHARSMRPGITPCVIKVAATYAVAIDRSHSPAASAGA